MPSLHEIEKAMCELWMNQKSRNWLLGDACNSACPAQIDSEILQNLDHRGAAVYARSINYEHQRMATRIFPYCARVAGKQWQQLVEDYYKHYPSADFDFNKICKNFPRFLKEQDNALLQKYPYLPELADYEWLELEKLEDKRKIIKGDPISIDSLERLQSYSPTVNQTLSIHRYRYPVADIADNFAKSKRARKKYSAKPCTMAIYRDPDSDDARFVELTISAALMVEAAQKARVSYQDLLKMSIDSNSERNPAQVAVDFLNLIEEFLSDNIFVGSTII